MIFHQQRLHEPLFLRIVLPSKVAVMRDRTAFLGEKMALFTPDMRHDFYETAKGIKKKTFVV
jgi:hypothetical protein